MIDRATITDLTLATLNMATCSTWDLHIAIILPRDNRRIDVLPLDGA
jgi:hypothetical protein